MALEIERKFLVESDAFLKLSVASKVIKQGYLSMDPNRTVRVRTIDEKGYITVKGKSSEDGLVRFEWEKEISLQDALALLELALPGEIHKTRYSIIHHSEEWTVDVFYGANEGLILAEVELESVDSNVVIPSFIGKEVTGNPKYYNSYLINHPFKTW